MSLPFADLEGFRQVSWCKYFERPVIASDAKRIDSLELISIFIDKIRHHSISQELFVFEARNIEQKKFVCDHKIDIRDEPAQSSSAIALFDGLLLRKLERYEVLIFTQL